VPVVDCQDVIKVYGEGAAGLTVLDRITLRVPDRALVALTGPCGSGKTTENGHALRRVLPEP